MSENTAALAMVDQTAALAAMGVDEDYVLRPQDLELIQPINAGEDATAGYFRDKKSKEQFKTFQIVPLKFSEGRVYFNSEELGSKPLCRSNDGKVPFTGDDNLVPQAKDCKSCSLSQWKTIGGKKIKPPCAGNMSLLFALAGTPFVYRLNVKRSGVTPMKDFRDTLFRKVMQAKAAGQFLPHFGMTALLDAVKIQGKKGTYFEIRFGAPKLLPDVNQYQDLFTRIAMGKVVDEPEGGEEAIDNAVNQEYVDA